MPETEGDDERPIVLIVDDEEAVADLYADTLADEYTVHTAYAGEEALEVIDSTVDIVLLDRRMPGLSGDDVVEEIRRRAIDCRVVMVTAVDPDLDVISLDFDDYLVKPVSAEELHDAVERMLARDAYDAQLKEALAIASKMATLESKMDLEDLEASDEYAALEARFVALRDRFDDLDPDDHGYVELSTGKLQGLIERLDRTTR